MENELILKKAIEKVELKHHNFFNGVQDSLLNYVLDDYEMSLKNVREDIIHHICTVGHWHKMIFSHGFAERFFPTTLIGDMGYALTEICGMDSWKIYLTDMVLEKDPVKYLEQFLYKHI